MQFEIFVIPISNSQKSIAELNLFLRSHKIITVNKEFVQTSENSFYSILVEYIAQENISSSKQKAQIDYKEVLSSENFALFSYLREERKKIAEQDGVPIYVVLTNAQMAEISTVKPKNISALLKIQGIGKSKCEKYGELILKILNTYKETK